MTPMLRIAPPPVLIRRFRRLAASGWALSTAVLAVSFAAAEAGPASFPAIPPAAEAGPASTPAPPSAAGPARPVAPRVQAVAIGRPVAEQGQIVFRHRSTRARLADEDLDAMLGSLAPGTRIRIDSPDGRSGVTGSYLRLGHLVVQLETPQGPVEYDRTAVRRLWVGKPRTGRGAVIGGVNGFLLGMLLGATQYVDGFGMNVPEGRSDVEQFGRMCFRWGLPVGLAGAGLGAVIGSFTTGWQPVSP